VNLEVIEVIKEYYADGSDNQTYFTQLRPNTLPNNTRHYSGCGATVWMNLFGWHTLNFAPTLLNGEPKENNDYINHLTIQLRNYLHTLRVPFSDQGLTWPWFMGRGSGFAQKILSHNAVGYKHRIRSFAGSAFGYRDGNWVFEIAKEYIIEKKKPIIVGYFQDWHFAIGYGIIEIPMKNGEGYAYLLKVNRGWGSKEYTNNYITISPKDIFACYGIDEFKPLSQG
jgi:hypothetical protein